METVIYESARRSQIWGCAVGHSGLHLRSNKTETTPTRIEVLLKPAYAVCLADYLDGLQIATAPTTDLPLALAETAPPVQPWQNDVLGELGITPWLGARRSVSGREDDESWHGPMLSTVWDPGPESGNCSRLMTPEDDQARHNCRRSAWVRYCAKARRTNWAAPQPYVAL